MKKLEDVNILVVGDIMLDRYVEGIVDRISPEAPVPVVRVIEEHCHLGGAGNTIRNIRELGCKVGCVAAIGVDDYGNMISDMLRKLEVDDFLYRNTEMDTTVKNRIIEKRFQTQLIRFDYETIGNFTKIKHIINNLHNINIFDIIIVSDYGKGVINIETMESLKKINAPIIVDPKPINAILYDDVFMVTPNKKEYNEMLFGNIEYIVNTLGKGGIKIFNKDQRLLEHIPADPVKVYSVSGAGDTVVATMAVCLALGMKIIDAAKVANKCGQYVVTQPGTSVVPKELFQEILTCQ